MWRKGREHCAELPNPMEVPRAYNCTGQLRAKGGLVARQRTVTFCTLLTALASEIFFMVGRERCAGPKDRYRQHLAWKTGSTEPCTQHETRATLPCGSLLHHPCRRTTR